MKLVTQLISGVTLLMVLVGVHQSLNTNAQTDVNLIQNSSFELLNPAGNNPLFWQRQLTGAPEALHSLSRTNVRTGSISARIDYASGTGEARWQPSLVAVQPSTTYTISLWYKSTTNVTAKYLVRVGTQLQWVTLGNLVPRSIWHNALFTITTPANANSLAPTVAITQIGTLELDDISIQLGSAQSSSSSSIPVSSSVSSSLSSSSSIPSSSSSIPSSSSAVPTPTPTPTATPVFGANFLNNASFETAGPTGAAGWQVYSQGAVDLYSEIATGEARTGARSAYSENSTGAGFGGWQNTTPMPILAGQVVRFSGWYMSGKSPTARFIFQTSAGIQVIDRLTTSFGVSYRQFSFDVVAPGGSQSVTISLGMTGVGWLHTDDLTLMTTGSSSSSSSSSMSNSASSSVSSSSSASQPVSPTATLGKWKPIQQTSVVGIQMVNLGGGKILLFDGSEGVGTGDEKNLLYEIYDTNSGVSTRYTAVDTAGQLIKYSLFCGAMISMTNGNIFFAGGDVNGDAYGSDKAATFNPLTNAWTRLANMISPRWYPSGITLQDGRILIVGGTKYDYDTPATTPEVYSFATGQWTELAGADDQNDPQYSGDGHFYPWLYTLRSGKIVNLGPRPTISKITTAGAGSLQNFAKRSLQNGSILSRFQQYGSVARISADEVLFTGGGINAIGGLPANEFNSNTPVGATSIARLDVIDQYTTATTNSGLTWYSRATGNLNSPRANAALVILADGNVMFTGGSSLNEGADRNSQYDAAVLTPELWQCSTGVWRNLAAQQAKRIYHSTGLLQIDGTVLTAGGSGFNGQCTAPRGNAVIAVKGVNACRQLEVYEPYYLFNSTGGYKTRPTYTMSSTTVGLNGAFSVTSPTPISQVTLVRPGIMTHGTNIEQYSPQVTVTGSGNSRTITMPADYYSIPKGKYFVFVWDTNGTPSIAKEITVN